MKLFYWSKLIKTKKQPRIIRKYVHTIHCSFKLKWPLVAVKHQLCSCSHKLWLQWLISCQFLQLAWVTIKDLKCLNWNHSIQYYFYCCTITSYGRNTNSGMLVCSSKFSKTPRCKIKWHVCISANALLSHIHHFSVTHWIFHFETATMHTTSQNMARLTFICFRSSWTCF